MILKYFNRVIAILIISLFSASSFAATDVHGVMCGGEIREADMTVINKYMADNPDVNITMEAVPWGTCQDKVINLAIIKICLLPDHAKIVDLQTISQ